MKRLLFFLLLPILTGSFFLSCKAQPASDNTLALYKTIPLPGVKGRIDHMDVNVRDGVVYMAALGNNTLEVIDLKSGKVVHSIGGLSEPQGVGYVPQQDEVFVANGGNGEGYFYNAKTFGKTGAVHLSSDADDVRYDSAAQRLYVGYGDGGIAVIDAPQHKKIGDVKLPAHPEGFQLDKALNRLYVNLPDAHTIGVVDMAQLKLVQEWPNKNEAANFPMAIDPVQHRLFIGYRHPPKLAVFDAASGKPLAGIDIAGDTDDLYTDSHMHTVYISAGNGAINILQEEGNTYKSIANIPTRSGARTSLYIPALHLFAVAARAEGGKGAELLVYKTAK